MNSKGRFVIGLLIAMGAVFAGVGSVSAQTAADADFDDSGEVGFQDFLLFAAKFNTARGDANYDARFDLDDSGAVGFADFLAFAGLFGQPAPRGKPPVADAGAYQSVDTGDVVTLDGSNSSDPEGQPLTFAWRQIDGPLVALSDASVARPTFRTGQAGHYTFELIVNNGAAESLPDTVAVDAATISEAAVFAGGPDASFTYKETSGDQMVFAVGSGAPEVQVGAVMVNTVDPFFLKKVTRVVSRDAAELVVETEDAALTDVVEEASVRQTLTFPDPASKVALIDLVSDPRQVCTDETEALCATASNISLSPRIHFDINIEDGGVDSLVVAAGVEFKADFEFQMEAAAGFSREREVDLKLGPLAEKLKGALKFGQSLSIPVNVTPELGFGVKGSIQVAGKFKAGVNVNRTINVGIKYKDGQFHNFGTGDDGDAQDGISPEIGLYGSVNLSAYAYGRLNVGLGKGTGNWEAGVGAVSFGLVPYVGFDAEASATSSRRQPTLDWAISMGVNAEVSVNGPYVRFFSLSLETFARDWEFALFQVTLSNGNAPVRTGPVLVDLNLEGVTYHGGDLYALYAKENGGRVYAERRNPCGSWEYRELFDLATVEHLTDREKELNRRIFYAMGIASASPGPSTKILYVVGLDDMPVGDGVNSVPRLYKYQNHRTEQGWEGWKQANVYHLSEENGFPVGIAYDNEGHFYVVDRETKKVHVYSESAKDGMNLTSVRTFDLDSGNGIPYGIVYGEDRIYVVDRAGDKVFAYARSGERVTGADFSLDDDNGDPSGIAYANGGFYVADSEDGIFYEYAGTVTVLSVRRLTNNDAGDSGPQWSPDGRQIAFNTDRDDGNSEIYVMESDGSDPRNLTNNDASDFHPSWSPDGRQIAFTSYRDGDSEIYVMGSDGSDPRNLTNNHSDDDEPFPGWSSDVNPWWSPDGRQIAFRSRRTVFGYYDRRHRPWNVWVMESDGSNPRSISYNITLWANSSGWPYPWSPDGRLLAFTDKDDEHGHIYVTDSYGSFRRALNGGASVHASNSHPSWSPDGRYIAFHSDDWVYREGVEIYVIGPDGRNPCNLTNNSRRAYERDPSWSPDGRYIAFTSYGDGNSEIYVMGSDGSDPRNLTNNDGNDGYPVWSPDGRRIAFISDRDGNVEIYVIDLQIVNAGGQ